MNPPALGLVPCETPTEPRTVDEPRRIHRSAREMMADPIYSAGFLIDDTEAGIVVAAGFNQHADDVEGAMAIPRSAIVKLEELRP